MIKISTSLNTVNYQGQQSPDEAVEQATTEDKMFYNSIKPQLDKLIKNPSDETIEKILAFSKKK
ncbi:hypothetical protein [Pedobacter sp. Hv1]|uniref:hypothetical protein n=1 Tax=Pedobacter sp. Hv1 TaxID=1740090 RepID=UPI0006D8C97F|nr:hypothetical protein [Pedobacter sp. Hv1]KQC02782.1 hypothetical protein AQF98_04190 [Pedobacter sp. Hv1]